MAVLISDDFAGVNGTNIEDRAPAVGSWERRKTEPAYLWGDALSRDPFEFVAYTFYAVTMADKANVVMGFDCVSAGNDEDFTILVRLAAGATKSGYGLRIHGKLGATPYIVRCDNDVETILATLATGDAPGHNYQLRAEGTTITAYRDSVSLGSVEDATYASGVFGFEIGIGTEATIQWDNALGETIAPAAPTLLTATCSTGIGESTLADVPASAFTVSASSGAAPLTVNCTDISTNSPTSWAWLCTNGETSVLQNPSFVLAAGIHVIRLTATNASGAGTPYQITVIATQTPVVTPPTGGTITPGGVIPGTTIQGLLGRIGYYAVDTENNQIMIYGHDGTLLKTFGGVGTAVGKFFRPTTCSVINGRQLLDRVVIDEE